MSRRTGIAGLVILAGMAGGGFAAVQYMRANGYLGGGPGGPTAARADGDPDAGRTPAGPAGDDRHLAESQGYCPVMPDTKLGEMGEPVKVMVKDKSGAEQPVFVCCKGCKRKALADPEATLAKVAELRAAAAPR